MNFNLRNWDLRKNLALRNIVVTAKILVHIVWYVNEGLSGNLWKLAAEVSKFQQVSGNIDKFTGIFRYVH